MRINETLQASALAPALQRFWQLSGQKIDLIFKKCFGHKMGPLETADLIGLDTVMRSLDVLYESFQDPKYRCCPLLRKLVHAGHLGRKTGRGFHVYPRG